MLSDVVYKSKYDRHAFFVILKAVNLFIEFGLNYISKGYQK